MILRVPIRTPQAEKPVISGETRVFFRIFTLIKEMIMDDKRINLYDGTVAEYRQTVSRGFCKQDFIEYNEILFQLIVAPSRETLFPSMRHVH